MRKVQRNLLTTGQAARLCSVAPDTILKWIKKGRITCVRTAGGHYRIERQVLEPLVASPPPAEKAPGQLLQSCARSLHCWEYMTDRGAVRDQCRRCVVYRVRASRCFLMAGLEQDVGHARQFCGSSCEDCIYYRRVNGLPTKVLVITSDDEFIDCLTDEEDESVTLCFARNAYEASAIIHDFRPAFATIDTRRMPAADSELLESLIADPRVPGVRIILAVPQGRKVPKRKWTESDLVVSVLEKPFGARRIAAVIKSFPVDSLEENNLKAAARKG